MRLPLIGPCLVVSGMLLPSGSATAQSLPPGQYRLQTILDVDTGGLPPRINRNNQVATLYNQANVDHVFVYGEGLVADHPAPGSSRYVNFDFSNWGTAILDFAGDGVGIAAAPLGQAATEVFRSPVSTSEPVINDTGRIAFYSRNSNGHGHRDVFVRDTGQLPELLPDLGADSLAAQPYLDEHGRVVVHGTFLTPQFSQDTYRYTTGSGWDNLTTGQLPADVAPLGTANGRPFSADGDFVIDARRAPVGSKYSYEAYVWDDSAQGFQFLLDNSSTFKDFFGNPYPMDLWAEFSDANDLWLTAYRLGVFGPEFRALYRQADGTTLDVGALLPSGYTLYPNPYFYSLNYDGDLWLTARNGANQNSYFLLQHGQLRQVIENTDVAIFQPVLSTDNKVYFWSGPDSNRDLVCLTVLPEPSAFWLALIGLASFLGFRQEHSTPNAFTRGHHTIRRPSEQD